MREKAPKGTVHFIGIGGSGMSGLAELALHLDYHVQGSDLKASSMLHRLGELGADIFTAHTADAIQNASSVVYSSAIGSENIEFLEAQRRGLPLLHRSDFLAQLMANKTAITVAGTHGKSTTSAMITHVLDDLGMSPWAAIGGDMLRYQSPARIGQGPLFVAEADESDGSFLKYRPFIGVLTNVELDHLDYFKTADRLEAAFATYLTHIDPDGRAVIGWDHPLSRKIGSAYKGPRLTFGTILGSEVRAFDICSEQGRTRFSAVVERDRIECLLPAVGRHNVQNALCTLAVVRALGLDVRRAAQSLGEFAGVARRMAPIYHQHGIRIFDDYAHNPGKVAACVKTLKETWPEATLHVVYQPHRYSRLETMYDAMLDALHAADYVYIVPVYSAGETTSEDFSPGRLAQDLARRFPIKTFPCEELTDAAVSVLRYLSSPAVVLTVGAGDVGRVAYQLKDALHETPSRQGAP